TENRDLAGNHSPEPQPPGPGGRSADDLPRIVPDVKKIYETYISRLAPYQHPARPPQEKGGRHDRMSDPPEAGINSRNLTRTNGNIAQQSSICIDPALGVADKRTPVPGRGKANHFLIMYHPQLPPSPKPSVSRRIRPGPALFEVNRHRRVWSGGRSR